MNTTRYSHIHLDDYCESSQSGPSFMRLLKQSRAVTAALAVAASLVLLAIFGFNRLPQVVSGDEAFLEQISNTTLGFQKLLVINLPQRTDHRDAMTLTGSLTGIHFDWIDGVNGSTIPDKALPPGNAQRFNKSGKGSWRAHINAIRSVVEQNLGSAVIFEDDIDWDIRVKDQLKEFASSARALIQPLSSRTPRFYDSSFPVVQDIQFQATAMHLQSLPNTLAPSTSPYGDNWDVLWLGHCGMRRPQTGLSPPWSNIATKISKGFVVHENDKTVPEPHYFHAYDDPGHPRFRKDFKNHTRVVHHAMDGICSLAYAVSQAGARKLLYALAVQEFDDLFDIMLRQFCDGQGRHEKHVCLTVQPTIFEHYRPAQTNEKGIFEEAGTYNVQWSTRLNIPKLLEGRKDFEDQFPSTMKP